MKLRGKARQRERARRRAKQISPMGMSKDRRQAMLRVRGGDLADIVGRDDECIEVLTQALELDPDDFRSRLTMSFVLLRLGQHERAWPHYSEAMTEDGRDGLPWLGRSLKGCTIAMRAGPDTALGDWIFGARYVRSLRERAAKVVIEVPTKLRSMTHNWSDVEVAQEGDPLKEGDKSGHTGNNRKRPVVHVRINRCAFTMMDVVLRDAIYARTSFALPLPQKRQSHFSGRLAQF